MAGTIFDDIETSPIPQPETTEYIPDPSEEFQEILAERTPEADEIARLDETNDFVDDQVIEEDRTQKRVEDLFPPQDAIRFDMLPRQERVPYYRNAPFFEKGDVSMALDLNETWNGDRAVAGIMDDLGTLAEIGATSWQLTTESQELAEEAASVLNRYSAGEFGEDKVVAKESLNEYRRELAERQQSIAKRFAELEKVKNKLKGLGIAPSVIDSMGKVAPSM